MIVSVALSLHSCCASASITSATDDSIRALDANTVGVRSRRAPHITAGCSVLDHGAVGGNRTEDAQRNTAALQAALALCQQVSRR
jgi:hypothetical protein